MDDHPNIMIIMANNDIHKKCSKCDSFKNRAENFKFIKKNGKYNHMCKECEKLEKMEKKREKLKFHREKGW